MREAWESSGGDSPPPWPAYLWTGGTLGNTVTAFLWKHYVALSKGLSLETNDLFIHVLLHHEVMSKAVTWLSQDSKGTPRTHRHVTEVIPKPQHVRGNLSTAEIFRPKRKSWRGERKKETCACFFAGMWNWAELHEEGKKSNWTVMGLQGLTELLIILPGINILRSAQMNTGDRARYLITTEKALAAIGPERKWNNQSSVPLQYVK